MDDKMELQSNQGWIAFRWADFDHELNCANESDECGAPRDATHRQREFPRVHESRTNMSPVTEYGVAAFAYTVGRKQIDNGTVCFPGFWRSPLPHTGGASVRNGMTSLDTGPWLHRPGAEKLDNARWIAVSKGCLVGSESNLGVVMRREQSVKLKNFQPLVFATLIESKHKTRGWRIYIQCRRLGAKET